MILVYLNNGECIEVQDAISAEQRNGSLVCLDSDGYVTAAFPATDVESFTASDEMADAIKEEICEDLVVMNNGEVIEEPDPA